MLRNRALLFFQKSNIGQFCNPMHFAPSVHSSYFFPRATTATWISGSVLKFTYPGCFGSLLLGIIHISITPFMETATHSMTTTAPYGCPQCLGSTMVSKSCKISMHKRRCSLGARVNVSPGERVSLWTSWRAYYKESPWTISYLGCSSGTIHWLVHRHQFGGSWCTHMRAKAWR